METEKGLFASLTASVTSTLTEVRQLKDTVIKHEKTIDLLNEQVVGLETDLGKERATNAVLNTELDKAKADEKKLRAEIGSLEAAKANRELKFKEMEESFQAQKDENEALKKKLKTNREA